MNTARVALITGGGRKRIGFHVAKALAERGFHLALHYHRSADEARESAAEFRQRGTSAEVFGADLTDEAAVRSLVAEVVKRFGRLDVLLTCAAVWKPTQLETLTAADVREQFEINTLGTLLCCREAGLVMAGQPEGGCLVTIGDWAVVRPYQNYAAYFASKGSLPTLTRMLAVELAARNPRVRVNCVLPGPVMLPDDLPEGERAAAIAGTLLKREGRPEHVALAVAHFVENDYLTGVCLPVDGGRSIYSSE